MHPSTAEIGKGHKTQVLDLEGNGDLSAGKSTEEAVKDPQSVLLTQDSAGMTTGLRLDSE